MQGSLNHCGVPATISIEEQASSSGGNARGSTCSSCGSIPYLQLEKSISHLIVSTVFSWIIPFSVVCDRRIVLLVVFRNLV